MAVNIIGLGLIVAAVILMIMGGLRRLDHWRHLPHRGSRRAVHDMAAAAQAHHLVLRAHRHGVTGEAGNARHNGAHSANLGLAYGALDPATPVNGPSLPNTEA